MVRKIVAAGVLFIGLSTGTAAVASAQDSPGPSVLPTSEVQVKGEVVLPRTGSDIGIDVIAGVSLTAAGLAFAATARQRRRRLETTPAAS